MARSIGVGFLGAGPVTQAIHLPTLATMPERFHVARVMDIDPAIAEAVAARCGARASTSADDVLDDSSVEVVAVCSPNPMHADQVVSACDAGKRLVLCEKPLAVSRAEANRIGEVAKKTGTPIVVGTMHSYDPAFRAAQTAWEKHGEVSELVHSAIFLPSNDIFIDQAPDQIRGAPKPPRTGNPSDPAIQSAAMRAAILGVTVHNAPMLRQFYPTVGEMVSARFLPPFGYALTMAQKGRGATLSLLMPGQWAPHWTLRAIGVSSELRVSFPPSYVLAGSARAEFTAEGETRTFTYAVNGYQAMWHHVSNVVEGAEAPFYAVDSVVDDIGFALQIADAADKVLV